MRLDEIVCREVDAELLLEIIDALVLMLAAAVGEQDEGDVVIVQEVEDLWGAGNWLRDVEQDAVDAISSLAGLGAQRRKEEQETSLKSKGKRRRLWPLDATITLEAPRAASLRQRPPCRDIVGHPARGECRDRHRPWCKRGRQPSERTEGVVSKRTSYRATSGAISDEFQQGRNGCVVKK